MFLKAKEEYEAGKTGIMKPTSGFLGKNESFKEDFSA